MLVQLGDKSVPEKRKENETPLKASSDETGRVISSPAQNKNLARHNTKGKVSSSAMSSIEAEAVTIGLPYLKARECIRIENIGEKFSGTWRISKIKHEISSSGYICSLTLFKNDHESSGKKSHSTPKNISSKNNNAKSVGEVKASNSSKPAKIKIDLKTGEQIAE